jgi:hypothetical protein
MVTMTYRKQFFFNKTRAIASNWRQGNEFKEKKKKRKETSGTKTLLKHNVTGITIMIIILKQWAARPYDNYMIYQYIYKHIWHTDTPDALPLTGSRPRCPLVDWAWRKRGLL